MVWPLFSSSYITALWLQKNTILNRNCKCIWGTTSTYTNQKVWNWNQMFKLCWSPKLKLSFGNISHVYISPCLICIYCRQSYVQTCKAEAFIAIELGHSPHAVSSGGLTSGWVILSTGFGHRWPRFLALSFNLVPFSLFLWSSSFLSLAGRVSSQACSELIPLSFSPLGWFVPFSSFEK